jgi:hypothetical protein
MLSRSAAAPPRGSEERHPRAHLGVDECVGARAPHGPATAVLTGDGLFIGDVGRPDLANLGDDSTTELARALYRSIHERLLTLPSTTNLTNVPAGLGERIVVMNSVDNAFSHVG